MESPLPSPPRSGSGPLDPGVAGTPAGQLPPGESPASQLAAFAQGAQEVKAAATQTITESKENPDGVSKLSKFWKDAQREKQGELDLEKTRLINQSFLEDMAARRVYARQIFTLIIGWLSAILLVLLLHGFSSKPAPLFLFHWLGSQWKVSGFQLSDPVLLALIGGTTASVLGLFAIVAKYFFPEKK